MTDLEITKACAEAMGIEDCRVGLKEWSSRPYDPLYNDDQAMELVKRFKMTTCPIGDKWSVVCAFGGSGECADLNRAICECVAKMTKG